MDAMAHEWRSKDDLQELVLSFLHVTFRGRTQRAGECLCLPPLLIFIVTNLKKIFFTAVTCSVKITWYILVLLVFMVGIILIIHKILEDHRRVQRWQSKY